MFSVGGRNKTRCTVAQKLRETVTHRLKDDYYGREDKTKVTSAVHLQASTTTNNVHKKHKHEKHEDYLSLTAFQMPSK
jgi:hypothetical protein